MVVSRGLSLEEHVYGLGERAYDLDRKRRLYRMWNTDVGCASAYRWYVDPMYASIPFFMVFDKEKAEGYFFNIGSEALIDVSFKRYDEVTVFVPEDVSLAGDGDGLDFFIFGEGGSIKLRSGVLVEASGGLMKLSSPTRTGKVILPTGRGLVEVKVGEVTAEVRLR